jgi:glycosyltransferase involved in cell wall biosynthesis
MGKTVTSSSLAAWSSKRHGAEKVQDRGQAVKILFVHQNMPGQYREMMQWLADRGTDDLVFLTQRKDFVAPAGVRKVVYTAHHRPAEKAYGLSRVWEEAAGAGYGAALACEALEAGGFRPDIVVGHTGWGEMLFLKQVWRDVPLLGFFEYFYLAEGGPVGFDPEQPPSAEAKYMLHARNAVPFANLHVVDRGIAPTQWQKDTFPAIFHDKIYCCHDGIRTDRLQANPDATVKLGRVAQPVRKGDEILTYVARNMERTRGFHIFMRALPDILAARPNARVLIVGGNGVSYGKKSDARGGFRAEMEAEVGDRVDWSRVHFLGQLPYADFQKVVQVSRCHVYLTMPFVLSWSLLEAMAMQATIVASDVAPVREAIRHGETGLLVDFHDPQALARQCIEVLANPAKFEHLGPDARHHVVSRYDFLTVCLPEHIRQMNDLVGPDKAMAMP